MIDILNNNPIVNFISDFFGSNKSAEDRGDETVVNSSNDMSSMEPFSSAEGTKPENLPKVEPLVDNTEKIAINPPKQNIVEDSIDTKKNETCPVRLLRFVLQKTGLKQLFEKNVRDPRCNKCDYSVASLLLMIVIMYILRFPSRNGFHDQSKLSEQFQKNISKLAGTKTIPCPKTFEDLFVQLDYHDLEPILPALFRWLLRSKFFKLHPEFKSKTTGDSNKSPFVAAVDAQVLHTYRERSQHPCENCPRCLKRTRGDAVWYIHYDVVLSILGENGFQMPLFVYHIQKEQQKSTNCSDEELKQQCELSAFPYLIEQFHAAFPRLQCIFLLDSLYANGPVMETLKKYGYDFMIVRKAGSLKSFTSDIEGLKKLVTPLKRTVTEGQWKKEQEVYVFPDMSHQNHKFTVIDLVERCEKVASSRFAKMTDKTTHWQWIVSLKVMHKKVFKVIHEARLRWCQEDFFNTMQCRGYNLCHDFSRNPLSQGIWQLLLFIAFAISILMQLSRLGCLSRGVVAMVNWILYLRGLLMASAVDFDEPLPKQLRFSFDSS
jgi:hypothetical protein